MQKKIKMAVTLLALSSSWTCFASPVFYSSVADEYQISFEAYYRTSETRINEFANWDSGKKNRLEHDIREALDYLFGPFNSRSIGGSKYVSKFTVQWDKAVLLNGRVAVAYHVEDTWMLKRDFVQSIGSDGHFKFPVILNKDDVFTDHWKFCTDSNASHQSSAMFWYYWDPKRYGCDHKIGSEYQEVEVHLDQKTTATKQSLPEYDRMVRIENGTPTIRATFAFGYFDEPENSNPYTDNDLGASEFRNMDAFVHGMHRFKEAPLYTTDFEAGTKREIGTRYEGFDDAGIHWIINVVIDARISAHSIFIKSFAHDHDALFVWMGHSEVGNLFSQDKILKSIKDRPEYFNVSNDYQIVYWGGCSGYAYYAKPLFELKRGTKNLDVMTNGLQNWFNLNSDDAIISLRTIMNYAQKPTYQNWIDQIEARAKLAGKTVMINVLGDEDNPVKN